MFTQWGPAYSRKMLIWLLLTCVIIGEQQFETVADSNTTEAHLWNSDHDYEYVPEWFPSNRTLGSVSAVAFDASGNIVVFHRGSHVWDINSFDQQNRYLPISRGPIVESTLLVVNNQTGTVINEWGSNFFYMPHGLTIDRNDSYWITDVAMHQVFKFNPTVSTTEPALALGRAFQPGSDIHSFCKPTSVAVLDNGDFFVADGYCNGRIMKYSSDGRLVLSWGKNSFVLTISYKLPKGPIPENFFAIPHALTYAADKDILCVADREQGRVQCFNAKDGTFHSMYSHPQIGSRIFSVKYSPMNGGVLYIINGPQFTNGTRPIQGFILSMQSNQIIARFFPNNPQLAFSNPHELAVSENGNQIYVAELSPTVVHKFKRKNVVQRFSQQSQSPLSSEMFPVATDSKTMEENPYTSTLMIVSIVGSLLTTSCLLFCVWRTICPSSTVSGRRPRFSTAVENISLRNLNHSEQELRETV
ncbi:peptidyl-alpha-hydroxyglycine alpha-amidating lyase 1 [Malaya genurostris]|uniref:peptidyl-alpha-hydroxyglycine alpha-amidating lyase 1 n=1 Tax=Malaya genurostris TaxID=325434 RepID=UPI0026F39CE0|nr:peptidyl-alpha-hydroxyglycine alpha-amidating lyase 1 [Malaya genurostris]XP_058463143.1 peptidyl-alpha-hydroxyglycine alpha-amidating lyase 1 [Malaya genurostris]